MQNPVIQFSLLHVLTVSALEHSVHFYKQSHPRSGVKVSCSKCLSLRGKFAKGHGEAIWLKQSLSCRASITKPTICLALTAAARISPLDLPYLFTQPGEVLCEPNHHYDEGPSCEHAGRPEQRVEDDTVVIQPGQENGLLLLAAWVVVTGDLLVHLQTIRDVHDHSVHGGDVLLAPGHIETLQG